MEERKYGAVIQQGLGDMDELNGEQLWDGLSEFSASLGPGGNGASSYPAMGGANSHFVPLGGGHALPRSPLADPASAPYSSSSSQTQPIDRTPPLARIASFTPKPVQLAEHTPPAQPAAVFGWLSDLLGFGSKPAAPVTHVRLNSVDQPPRSYPQSRFNERQETTEGTGVRHRVGVRHDRGDGELGQPTVWGNGQGTVTDNTYADHKPRNKLKVPTKRNAPRPFTGLHKAIVGLQVVNVVIDGAKLYRRPDAGNLHNFAVDSIYAYSALYGVSRLSIVGNLISIGYAGYKGGIYGALSNLVVSAGFMLVSYIFTPYITVPIVLYSAYTTYNRAKDLYYENSGEEQYITTIKSYQMWIDRLQLLHSYVSDASISEKIHAYTQAITASREALVKYKYEACKAEARFQYEVCKEKAALILQSRSDISVRELIDSRDKALEKCSKTYEEMAICDLVSDFVGEQPDLSGVNQIE